MLKGHELSAQYQEFLEEEFARDAEFVQNEFHYLNANCSNEGLKMDIPLFPVFLGWEEHESYLKFGELVEGVLGSMLEVVRNPHHSHCTDMKSILGVDAELEEILNSKILGRMQPGVVRPDTVLSMGQIKAHEFNVSWPGGIADSDIIMGNLFENTLFKKFVDRMENRGVTLHNPGRGYTSKLLLQALLETAEMENPYIVLVHPRPYNPEPDEGVILALWLQEEIRSQGYDCDMIYPDQFEYENGDPTYAGRHIDVAYRLFEWKHVQGDPGFLGYKKILGAALNGDLAVVNSFVSEILSAKSVFELIWDDDFLPCFSQDLIEEIRTYIPRTFNLLKASDEDLDYITETKDSWVVKPVKGSCGMKVFLGKLVDDHGFWNHILQEARAYDFMVAQEYVETKELNILRLSEHGLIQEPCFLDINPFYIHGRMGHYFSRWSRTYMTAQCGPGMGGMFPVVVGS